MRIVVSLRPLCKKGVLTHLKKVINFVFTGILKEIFRKIVFYPLSYSVAVHHHKA